MRYIALTLLLASCSSNPPAPVIDRLPSHSTATSKSASPKTAAQTKLLANRPTYKPGDWRPDHYAVKKGDTLFSIGLEYGYDYKDIAHANYIEAPYTIKVGQTLQFGALKDKPDESDNKAAQTNSDGVTTYPIGSEPATTSTATPKPKEITVVAINDPKAIREPYSDEALKTPLPISKPAVEKTTTKPVVASSKPVVEAKADAKSEPKPDTKTDTKAEPKKVAESPEDIDWAWPTKGKVTAEFNDASNKGIDIAGSTGQSIQAAAAGKVIYSGSDLRGYGKLVIIKHNSTYLSVYAHNSLILVKEGQQVSRGQKIAEMGNTDSNTVNLHFEIRRQGKSVDPSKYLAAN
ncbi:murein hydrolase activator NlpD precursor [mine drainage metagenome]|uniref:Murein hydrolase activator NlpD n=1 Tax=mine drainage metagenome TaxID=410659 RepID=A0A1J5SEC4_9ZZZZ